MPCKSDVAAILMCTIILQRREMSTEYFLLIRFTEPASRCVHASADQKSQSVFSGMLSLQHRSYTVVHIADFSLDACATQTDFFCDKHMVGNTRVELMSPRCHRGIINRYTNRPLTTKNLFQQPFFISFNTYRTQGTIE